MNKRMIQKKFLNNLHSSLQLRQLFEYLPDVYFFMKNIRGQFISVNRFYLEMCNLADEEEIIGKTDHDFFPRNRADKYVRDDQHVISTQQPMVNIVELAPENSQTTNWVIVSKVPLFSKNKEVIGTAGFGRNYNKGRSALQPYAFMADVIKYIDDNYGNVMEITDLARLVNLSVSQFERKFKKTFQLSPSQHIMQVRLKAACGELVNTDDTISNIALKCGFYDHSHFTRLFSRTMRMTPKEYRKRY